MLTKSRIFCSARVLQHGFVIKLIYAASEHIPR